ncbi:hypothetical protein H9X85_09950 [Anaerotignum lactatifermentans]|uniref:Uncharacterized protein n=1 Tax=Anaerotignum lactatifermentans TaxID=160404 RepID=A0ABS2GCM0_9FIRM|nr:hypothetical protein [Anaerotignum lactatifermentans]MBM6829865.1 hypothetical protein [Anaerotignum lactatifermentans]MBM6878367.1 hypothetical protein [Anaerotignum lactatifermentans]MBM6951522.1 hypothetical protein [Anaerotignum lactatifermentans]
MDQNRKQALAAGCLRIRREIAAWLLMMLWVIFSGSIAEELLGEALPGWVMIGGMILCGVLAVAAHLDNPLRHGYKLRRPRRYLLGAVVILLLVVVLFVLRGQDFAALRSAAIPLIFVWNPICVWLEWKEELKQA